ncbi:hypothetical protein HaLaN_14196, partial [Haematococcus lacustris]
MLLDGPQQLGSGDDDACRAYLAAQVSYNDDATSPTCSFDSLLSRLTTTLTNGLPYWLMLRGLYGAAVANSTILVTAA